jgi:hypothetical protein
VVERKLAAHHAEHNRRRAIAPHDLQPALEDVQSRMAEQAAAPRPITQFELYRGVVYPVRAPIPSSFESLKIQSTPTAPVLDVTEDAMSAWTLSPLVAQLFAGAFAVPGLHPHGRGPSRADSFEWTDRPGQPAARRTHAYR